MTAKSSMPPQSHNSSGRSRATASSSGPAMSRAGKGGLDSCAVWGLYRRGRHRFDRWDSTDGVDTDSTGGTLPTGSTPIRQEGLYRRGRHRFGRWDSTDGVDTDSAGGTLPTGSTPI